MRTLLVTVLLFHGCFAASAPHDEHDDHQADSASPPRTSPHDPAVKEVSNDAVPPPPPASRPVQTLPANRGNGYPYSWPSRQQQQQPSYGPAYNNYPYQTLPANRYQPYQTLPAQAYGPQYGYQADGPYYNQPRGYQQPSPSSWQPQQQYLQQMQQMPQQQPQVHSAPYETYGSINPDSTGVREIGPENWGNGNPGYWQPQQQQQQPIAANNWPYHQVEATPWSGPQQQQQPVEVYQAPNWETRPAPPGNSLITAPIGWLPNNNNYPNSWNAPQVDQANWIAAPPAPAAAAAVPVSAVVTSADPSTAAVAAPSGWTSGAPNWRRSFTPVSGQSGCFNKCRPSCGVQYPGPGYGCKPACRSACNIKPSCGFRPPYYSGNTMFCGGKPNYNQGWGTGGHEVWPQQQQQSIAPVQQQHQQQQQQPQQQPANNHENGNEIHVD